MFQIGNPGSVLLHSSVFQVRVQENWVPYSGTLGGQLRREILDHVIALNGQHLRRLIRDYVNAITRTAFTIRWRRTRRVAEHRPEGNDAGGERSLEKLVS